MVTNESSSLTGASQESSLTAEFTGTPVKVGDVYANKVIYVYERCLCPITGGKEILELGSPCCVSPSRIIEMIARPLLHRILFFGFFVVSVVNMVLWAIAPRWIYFFGAWIGFLMITAELILELILFFFVDIWISLYWDFFLVFYLKTSHDIAGLKNNFIRFKYSDKTSVFTTDFETHALFAHFQRSAELNIMVYNTSWILCHIWNRTIIPTWAAFLCGMLLLAPNGGQDDQSLGTDGDDVNIALKFWLFFLIYLIGFYCIKAAVCWAYRLVDCLLCGSISKVLNSYLGEHLLKKLEQNTII